ncbi:DUF2505 domain-containing protein [Cellulomonas sp. zg-ZUI222]|uniref:DUF2505 domain-containing protein n=1 Tax=Cellulomonas wangleii TaxID=2816956 RepID=A0ABX8D2J4_9CELL|nr:DUF2505 domain-containing protein [Cellulomonas sp. zg-ZUI22]MBO0922829.1 DUF2505 domain-containing protein [Cellulomonas wangleii]MBO0925265.1 DUF2505 domain-containing protein [Cellulomonas wangleii]QVI61233.1 DUF2505 domain-containing protein [Cellulomonas wangleii]
MQLHVTIELPTDVVGAARLLADPAYVHAKVRAAGAVEQQVDVTGSADAAFTVTSRRALPTAQIPPHLRPFVGDRIDVRQVEAWEAPAPDGSRSGTVVVEIAGAPVRVTGRTSLVAAGPDAARVTYDGEVRAAVPLFAAAVEEAAATAVRGALGTEETVAARWLAGAHDDAPQGGTAPR